MTRNKMTKQQLQQDLKQSMLARNVLKTSVLRLLLSSLNYYEIHKGGAGYEASEEDVLSVIQKEVKQRKDSIEQFTAAGRQELADKEQKELKILQTYLPEQMSEIQIREIVQETIREIGATSVADMGKVMGALMLKVKGKADGNLVSQVVKNELSAS
ncbi:MAG: GatB/YqeY domain-containing protein [bacterium]|nr:GatB/YqeY domain-containing protein [bacterium]